MTKRHLGYDLPYVKKAYRVLDIMVPTRKRRNVSHRNGNSTSSNTRRKIGEAAEEEEEAVNTLVSEPQTSDVAVGVAMKDDTEGAINSRPEIIL